MIGAPRIAASGAAPAPVLPAARVAGGPVAMFFLCLCGMAVGLAIDCGSVPPEVLASLCLAGADSPLATLYAHMTLLPATHLLMLAGAVIGLGLGGVDQRSGRRAAGVAGHAAMLAAMFAGMVLAAWLVPEMAARFRLDPGFAGLVGAMVAGMALGMGAAVLVAGRWPASRAGM